MKPIKTFAIGSTVFFNKFSDFVPHDTDELCLMNEWNIKNTNVLRAFLHNKDVFFYKNMSKEEFIQETLESETPMKLGKFLVPQFCEHLGVTIEDLKKLESVVDKLDEKHKYEKVIFESYIKNDNFTLTESQLEDAYALYKQSRNIQ